MRINLLRVAERIGKRITRQPFIGRSILLYHRIAKADFDPTHMAVTPEEFEYQLNKTPKEDSSSAEGIRKTSCPAQIAA